MAQVTVGVPVYNGANYLEKCLTCLRDQTYRDIEVLIYDNCSEDATGEIAQRFCAADPRFRYFRQPENRGVLANFLGALEAARSPFFMWRAADDTSDLNYIETLLALLLAHPERDLAAARVVSAQPDGTNVKLRPISLKIARSGIAGELAQFLHSNGCWIYGLFRPQVMITIFREVMAHYPYVWGWDAAALIPLGLDKKVIGTNATTFYQYRPFRSRRPEDDRYGAHGDARIKMVQSLEAFARLHVDRRVSNSAKRWFYYLAVAYYGHKRCSIGKRLRRRILRPDAASVTP